MKMQIVNFREVLALYRQVLLSLLLMAGAVMQTAVAQDILYIGDVADNTVKRFDAETGQFLDADDNPDNNPDAFVRSGSGGLTGPMGLLFDGDLLVVNQNVDLNIPGEVLVYQGQTGAFQGALVSHTDPKAPFAPRGMVMREGRSLYVADFIAGAGRSSGKIRLYGVAGEFLDQFATQGQHPRGVVFGPDGLLYVAVRSVQKDGLGGKVLRFSAEGKLIDVFIDDKGGVGQLNRPEGLVFAPDGKLYVTSFRANPEDTDAIRVYDAEGAFVDRIDLYQVGEPRVAAQALLFGPQGRLFVPLSNTGELRRYDVDSKTFDVLALPYADGGVLQAPWYLTFGRTDPQTLEYRESEEN